MKVYWYEEKGKEYEWKEVDIDSLCQLPVDIIPPEITLKEDNYYWNDFRRLKDCDGKRYLCQVGYREYAERRVQYQKGEKIRCLINQVNHVCDKIEEGLNPLEVLEYVGELIDGEDIDTLDLDSRYALRRLVSVLVPACVGKEKEAVEEFTYMKTITGKYCRQCGKRGEYTIKGYWLCDGCYDFLYCGS